MFVPDDKVEIIDETVVTGDMPDESEKVAEKVDDTTSKEALLKKEEETNGRMKRLEESNGRLMKMFTSPEFFAKLGNSMKPVSKDVIAKPTAAEAQAYTDKLEAMNRQEFLSHTLSKVGEAATAAVKPEVEKLSTQMSTFIKAQAENSAGGAVKDFISRVGQTEFDKYGAVMQAKANATKGLSMDDLYELASGKKAPKYAQNIIPNKTLKPGEGLKEMTEQKDLSLDEASSRNFDHIFGKSK